MLSVNFRIFLLFAYIIPSSSVKFVPFCPFSKRKTIVFYSFIETSVAWWFTCLDNLDGMDSLIKHSIPLTTQQLSQSAESIMPLTRFYSETDYNPEFKQPFERINLTFHCFKFSKSHLVNIHQKTRPEKKV